MNLHEHLPLPEHEQEYDRKKSGYGRFELLGDRSKRSFYEQQVNKANQISTNFKELKRKYKGKIDPNLIFELKINQSVNPDDFVKTLDRMGIEVLSIAENKKGYWIAFAIDEDLQEFKKRLRSYASEGLEGPKYEFFNAIDSIEDIPIEQKIGEALIENPLKEDISEFVNVELWRMDDERLNKFIRQMEETFSSNNNFRITDRLITNTFALMRIKLDKKVFDQLIKFKEIAYINRPALPEFNPFEYYALDVEELKISGPNEDAYGILIVDSGIISGHPLLEKAVGDEANFQEKEDNLQDTVGHGTAVAGVALYGDIEECVTEKEFKAQNWIFSAKVMYAEKNFSGEYIATYDKEKLVENQLKDAIKYFLDNPDNKIKVVNISLGNHNEIWRHTYHRQLPLAALIDELALSYEDIVFVISAGNQDPRKIYNSLEEIKKNYPDFLKNNSHFNITNPATSALALTVGAIATFPRKRKDSFSRKDIWITVAKEGMPAPFTRKGPGINNMVKPELSEYGGNLILKEQSKKIFEDIGGKLLLLSNKFPENLFHFDYGTSFSAPKVARCIAIIANHYRDANANLLKNLLLQSAEYPPINNDTTLNEREFKRFLLFSEGYGIPNIQKALYSFDHRVLLFNEGEIPLNKIKLFSLEIPSIFFTTKGKKIISIALTYNPPFRPSRGDSYIGNILYFKLFRDVDQNEILAKYSTNVIGLEETPQELKKFEIGYFPGVNTLKNGCHQKAWIEYKRQPKNIPSTITLVLISQNRWNLDDNYKQKYCLSVVFKHEQEIELYNEIKTRLQIKERVRVR